MGSQAGKLHEDVNLQAIEPVVERLARVALELERVRVLAGGHRVGEKDFVGGEFSFREFRQFLVGEPGPAQSGLRVAVLQAGVGGAFPQGRCSFGGPGAEWAQGGQLAGDAQAGGAGERLVELVLEPAASVEQLGELFEILRVDRPHAAFSVRPAAWCPVRTKR